MVAYYWSCIGAIISRSWQSSSLQCYAGRKPVNMQDRLLLQYVGLQATASFHITKMLSNHGNGYLAKYIVLVMLGCNIDNFWVFPVFRLKCKNCDLTNINDRQFEYIDGTLLTLDLSGNNIDNTDINNEGFRGNLAAKYHYYQFPPDLKNPYLWKWFLYIHGDKVLRDEIKSSGENFYL